MYHIQPHLASTKPIIHITPQLLPPHFNQHCHTTGATPNPSLADTSHLTNPLHQYIIFIKGQKGVAEKLIAKKR
jgi:hypothetical protein